MHYSYISVYVIQFFDLCNKTWSQACNWKSKFKTEIHKYKAYTRKCISFLIEEMVHRIIKMENKIKHVFHTTLYKLLKTSVGGKCQVTNI